MNLTVLTSAEELHALCEDWRKLMEESADKGIYLCHEWCCAGYDIFHRNDKIYLLILTDDSKKLTGIAPLVITYGTYRGIKVRKICFVRNPENPAHNFILQSGTEEVCLEIIMEHLFRFLEWELIELQMLDINAQTGIILQKMLLEKHCAFGTKFNRQSPYFLFDISWEEFWKSRSKKFKKAMRNKLNRAANQKNLVIEKILLSNGNAPDIHGMIKISSNSWKGKIRKDLASNKDNLEFYKRLCDIMGPKGATYLWLLKINHVPVAFEFHIEHEGIVYPLRADFDENYKDLSPGSVLEYEIVKSLFKQGNLSEYHSCGHNYAYLLNWTNKIKNYQNFEIFDKKLKMTILYNFEHRIMVMLRKCGAYHYLKKFIKPSKA